VRRLFKRGAAAPAADRHEDRVRVAV
jgi:hypothetical protein